MAKNITQTFSYLTLEEPKLLFHTNEPQYSSIKPIEGLNAWGPYDFSIPGYLRPNPLRLAIVAPQASFKVVARFLDNLTKEAKKTSKDEYLISWPGFRQAFQTNLELPSQQDKKLLQLISADEVIRARNTAHPEVVFLELLKQRIRVLLPVRHEFDVLIIYIPKGWADFRERHFEDYYFDLHDALKVFGAPNNLAIQIVEERSVSYPDQARVMWWLGLALYVKGGGIPWKLADASRDTAFVGLSYGVTRATEQRIILGCSQVFDEHGEGLKFLLHPIESPIFKGKNPFMSKEDARRLLGRIREIYQEVNGQRPKRIVVHKTTHFTSDEMSGIAEALSGIDEIELLQIQDYTKWRAIAFDPRRNGASNFPLKRGTVLPLNKHSFLLWTQGDVMGVAGKGRHYYQEKKGIPAPLVIRRFRGKDSLEHLAYETLRLTKMNWNNAQLYNRMPVTITFSSQLARIAKQLDRLWSIPYDFRYFM